MRRLCFWQQVARNPFRYVALLATVFGHFPFDVAPVLDENGAANVSSHPWIVQLCDDVDALMVSDVVSHIAEQMARRPLRLFCSPLREEFLKVDCSILRQAFLCVSIAPPGYQAPAPASPLVPGPDDQLSDHEPYICHDILPDGSVCQATFPSLRALQVHRRRAVGYGFVAPESFLAVTNQCPWCNVVYASIAHCRRHIKKSLASHQCRGGGSVVPIPLLPVETLVCQKYGHETENVSALQSHLVDYFDGKDFSAPWN